jgi:hypothetical protein
VQVAREALALARAKVRRNDPGSANEQATKHASLLSFSLHLVCVLLYCGLAIYAEGTKS